MVDEKKYQEKASEKSCELKELVMSLEKQRDLLMDEIAFKKGQVSFAEDLIRKIYERILEINKEIQNELALDLAKESKSSTKQEEADNLKGVKTPRAKPLRNNKKTKKTRKK